MVRPQPAQPALPTGAQARLLSQSIYRILTKKHGLKLSADAADYLLGILAAGDSLDRARLEETLDYVAQQYVLQESGPSSGAANRATLQEVVEGIFLKSGARNRFVASVSTPSIDYAPPAKVALESTGIDDDDVDDDIGDAAARAGPHTRRPDPTALLDSDIANLHHRDTNTITTSTPAEATDPIEADDDPNLIQDVSSYLHVIDAFSVPHYRYHADRGIFIRGRIEGKTLAPAESRTALFRDRYELIKQRLLRNEAFRAPTFTSNDATSYFQITSIIHLKGKKPGAYLLYGMLTSIQDGKYALEDPDAFIELELHAQTQHGSGLFTRNCFVLVQGHYTESATFRVDVMGHPLPEHRDDSVTAFGSNVDFFGAPCDGEDRAVLKAIETNATNVSFVFLSDVWLDQTRVLDRLRTLFHGFSQAIVPLAFVFIGNFSSTPYIYNGVESKRYREGFDNLADLVSEFHTIAQQSHFVFVPGPHDPWASHTLPRVPLPDVLTARLSQRIKHVHFSTAPCRIKYCTQEIVVFRDDLANAMRRHAILPVSSTDDVPFEQNLVSTILDQSYLTPLPIEIKPRYWEYDQALRLYPQPHLLVMADKCDPYIQEYEGTLCVNPGSFPNTQFRFVMYSPSMRRCEPSRVPE